MLENAAILVVTLAGLVAFLSPALRNWPLWRAMVTPLASIIGSGFLVLGPVLNNAYGRLAPLVMAGLCLVAWGFGGAVRANIASLAAHGMVGRRVALERLADLMLAFAYVISVAYYLNLFGAFALGLLPLPPGPWARLVTSAVYLVILIVGWTKGFRALERMELFSVSLKLAIILGLILGLGWDAAQRGINGEFASGAGAMQGWPALTLAFGLIVTVQGFETSRYLGADYPAGLRIRSMRLAQIVSSGIYMAYVGLLVLCFAPAGAAASETAIIGMMSHVAPVLPALLVTAALAAQFSAAVADTAGAGGLVSEQSKGRFSPRFSYVLLVVAGLVLTWALDVFAIIAFASRAFAIYYALQAVIAAYEARKTSRFWALGWLCLALLAISMAVFGRSVE